MSEKVDFTDLALEDINDVFGERGVALAKLRGYVLSDVNKVRLDDDLVAVLYLTEEGSSNPLVRIHEFAHFYHCVYWPDISDHTDNYRVEAVAMVAEIILRKKATFPPVFLLERARRWEECTYYAKVKGVVDRVAEFCYDDFHTTMGAILWGKFG